jgi:hypothetical protein
MEVSGQLQAPVVLTPSDIVPRNPLDMRLGGLQSRSGHCGEEKKLAPARNRTPAVQPVTRRYTDGAIQCYKGSKDDFSKPFALLRQDPNFPEAAS